MAATDAQRGRPVSGDKHRELLDAGLRTFAARGYHGTSVPDVAEAAGMAVGTVYRYFANKDALVNEVYRDAKERLRLAVFEPALPGLDRWQQLYQAAHDGTELASVILGGG